ncbi:MAG: nitroreductase [Paracoccaceae bacterium]|tara:strand:+ start:126 stop:704 length:579 start_codon:yes stop_codon:yes gene_type:complete
MNQIKKAPDFFSSRRSISVKNLKYPGPNENQIMEILKNSFRVPDHGKLEPWRIVLITDDSKKNYTSIMEKRGKEINIDPLKIEKSKINLSKTPLIVTVICSPFSDSKIPEIEQILSCGALCMNILNNFLANGWGANWLTGWMANDKKLGELSFNNSKNEFVAGYIYIGSFDENNPDRPRPNLDKKISYFRKD